MFLFFNGQTELTIAVSHLHVLPIGPFFFHMLTCMAVAHITIFATVATKVMNMVSAKMLMMSLS
jgi:hypothetical protein